MADGRVILLCTPPDHRVVDDQTWAELGAALGLSPRGLEITKGIFDDLPECAIAYHLGISAHTVHSHIERLYHRLQVNSRVQLVVRVLAELQRLDGDTDHRGPRHAVS